MKLDNYEQRIKNESDHFSTEASKFQTNSEKVERGFAKVSAFAEAHKIGLQALKQNTRVVVLENLIREHASKNDQTRIISLGCGTGDWEIELTEKAPNKIKMELVEINSDLMKYAEDYAKKHNLSIGTIIQDVNKLSLKENYYDFVLVRSALHHFVEFEHIFTEINKALKPDGKFLVMGEVIGRNGQILYDETRQKVQQIMDVLPEKFRFNHNTKTVDEKFPDIDYSENSFESIRSEDILPLITKYFKPIEYVTFDAFISYLLDFRYGPNYDLNNKLDHSIIQLIVQLDIYYLRNKILKPTSLFGIFGRK